MSESFRSPNLTPGDVASLSRILSAMLASNPPPSFPVRRAIESTMDRLVGVVGVEPPDLPRAFARWLGVLPGGDKDAIFREGVAAIEVAYLCGDHQAAEELHAAMEECATKLAARPRAPEAATAGPDNEKGSAEAIKWHWPDPDRFYSLGGKHGDAIRDLIEDLRNAKTYMEHCIDAPTRLLFVGEPGNGKTEGARYIGGALGLPVALLRLAKLGSSYINRTQRNLYACFEAAREHGAIILIDELDGLGQRRDAKGDGSEHYKKVVTAMNQLLDEIPPEQIVICATNIPDAIDPAIGERFTRHVTFGPPDRDTRSAIVSHHWRKMVCEACALTRIVDLTEGRSGRNVRKAAHEAAVRALRAGRETIEVADVHAAMAALPRTGKLETSIVGLS